jgi:hypothetical protein
MVMDGVLHLPMHQLGAAEVMAQRKRLFMLNRGDGNPLVFMRAADVIAAWPQVEQQVRSLATAYGLAL